MSQQSKWASWQQPEPNVSKSTKSTPVEVKEVEITSDILSDVEDVTETEIDDVNDEVVESKVKSSTLQNTKKLKKN